MSLSKPNLLKSLLLILFLANTPFLSAQISNELAIDDINWKLNLVQSFGSENGLKAKHINDFAFDENGITWISTDSGIWLSDGNTVFPLKNSQIDSSRDYSKLAMLSNTVWFADNEALYSINATTLESKKYALPDYVLKVRPHSISSFNNMLVINTSSGPLVFSLQDLSFFSLMEVPQFSEQLSSSVAFDSVVIEEKLYVGFGSYFDGEKRAQGGMAVYDSNFELINYAPVISLFSPWTIEYIDGLIHAATSNSGLIAIDPEDLSITYEIEPPIVPGRTILSAYKNQSGLWMSLLQRGLIREKDNRLFQFTKEGGQISSNMTSVAKIDGNGHLWVGYFDSRIDVVNTNNIDNIMFNALASHGGELSVSFASDEGQVVGTAGSGLIYGDEQIILSKFDGYKMNDIISAIDGYKSHLAIGTQGGGVWMSNSKGEYEKLIDQPPFNRLVINDIAALESQILTATAFGFYVFDYDGNLLNHIKSENRVKGQRLAHFNRKDGFLYDGFRLGRFKNNIQNIEWRELEEIKGSGVTDLTAKTSSSVYLISGNKLLLYDFDTDDVIQVFESYRHLTNVMYSEEHLFITDSDNLYIFDSQKLRTYSGVDGFRGTDIEHKALQVKGETLFVTSKTGIQKIKFRELNDFSEPNNAVVSSVILNGDTKEVGFLNNVSLMIQPDISFANLEITIPSYYVNRASLDFSIPQLLDEWLPLDESMTLQLPLNHYGDFKVLLRDRNTRSPVELDLSYIVLKPWWMTATSIFIFSTIGFLTTFLTYNARKKSAKRQKTILEEKVRNRTRELNSVLEQKNTLFENISHEFKTPLTIILSCVKSSSSELRVVENQCERLLTLVNNLLALSEARSPTPKLSVTNLESKAILLINGLETLTAERGLKIEKSITLPNRHAEVYEGLLDLLINNILGNAIKYASKNSVITFLLRGKADSLELEVMNYTDKVVNESALERYKTSHREQQNTGLGLDIVKELVNRLNGKLHVSYLDSKFAISVLIPVSFVDEDAVKIIKPDVPSQRSDASTFETKPLVMIVEDNSELRRYLRTTFERCFEIVEAKDGQEALDKLDDSTTLPSLIISDVMMPNMDGFELCKKIKKDAELNCVPFILLTAKTDLTSQAKGYELQADDYIGKPFNSDILLSKSSNLIRTLQRANASAERALLGVPKSIEDEFVSELRAILDVNYFDSKFSAKSLANNLNVSERTLERRLSVKLGSTFSAVLRKFRIERACEMLINGKSIKETAYDCGFASQSYFGQCFKQERGVTPSCFVKKYIK